LCLHLRFNTIVPADPGSATQMANGVSTQSLGYS
jgi:hypothetical protein